jgi:hypothetical protein
MTKKVILAIKAIYDFIVYVGCEIGKHQKTIRDWSWERCCWTYEQWS